MSWWERSSPMEWSRMTPRARMLAGLSGLGMGNTGVEIKGTRGVLVQLNTVQPVAAIHEARTVARAQIRPMMPLGMRIGTGFGGLSAPLLDTTNAVIATAPVAPAVVQDQVSWTRPATVSWSAPKSDAPRVDKAAIAPVKVQSASNYASGTAVKPDEVAQLVDQPMDTPAPDAPAMQARMSDGQGAVTSGGGGGGSSLQKKPPNTGTIRLNADAGSSPGPLGVPPWVWLVGGAGAALLILHKVTR